MDSVDPAVEIHPSRARGIDADADTHPRPACRLRPAGKPVAMRLYHVTDRGSAERIREQGFNDTEVIHDDSELLIGVWLADRCLAGEEDVGPRLGPVPDVALWLDLPPDEVEPYERTDREKPYREFCVPARVVNEHEIGGLKDLEDFEPNERRRRGHALDTP